MLAPNLLQNPPKLLTLYFSHSNSHYSYLYVTLHFSYSTGHYRYLYNY